MTSRLAHALTVAVIFALSTGCSGWTSPDECAPGETSECDTQCGLGSRSCDADGRWGACEMSDEPACLPGDFGACELASEAPPGLWFCSDDCRVGPCRDLCMPGERFDCVAECGPGVRTCGDDGGWSECREVILPYCRPGDVERCEDGVSYRRCGDDCGYGPCEEGPCAPGEIAECGRCASQACREDGSWSDCAADAWAVCSPDQVEDCDAPCGPGRRVCTDACEWTSCREVEWVPCHPGDRQMCPTTLYCGLAFRVCNSSCDWGDCIETGD